MLFRFTGLGHQFKFFIMEALLPQALKLLGIIWINVILSGDNAVVIALACRGLPEDQRRIGMILGAGVAVGLRLSLIHI